MNKFTAIWDVSKDRHNKLVGNLGKIPDDKIIYIKKGIRKGAFFMP